MKKCSSDNKPFNAYVTIQKPSTDSGDANTYGEIDLSDANNWSTHCVRRAHRRPLRGDETVGDDQVVGERVEVFEMFGDPDTRRILTTYRLTYTDVDSVAHVLGIIRRDVTPDNQWVTLTCVENASVEAA